ncbi:hypothetical protein CEP49_02285 [Mergibacter septicus]|uniref:methyltransferase regulatory domain-containing protein n=1 Tax=Mergibacter septicus TaxID=221402 RepID=UPI00117905CE|nr:methyltransferase regulatory domain-containing protein [Mergibacter septicus]AWX13458.1 hypothetical protein CEP49_02285 [Mergibacter septicus]
MSDEVKDAIIYLSSQLLSEEGLAYISYNVYPGWKSREIVRDLMLISSKNEIQLEHKLAVSKAALTNYIETIKDINDQSVLSLCQNAQVVLDNPNDSYVYHEYLEDYNNPCYFEQFIQRVRKYNLDYLIDASILPSYNIRTQIVEGEDRIAREQINDFLFNRTFRASILTPKANAIKAKDSLNLVFAKTNLDKLEFSGQFTFEDNKIKDITGRAQYPESFTTITKELTENYPNTITTQYLIDKYPELKDMIHDQLLKLIAYASVNFTIHKLEKIKYEVGKSRLKNGYIQYFNYFANEEAPNLMPANMLNDTLKLTPNHARFAVMFDGNNSVDEIIAAVKAYMQEYDLHFTQTQADGTEQKILDTDEIEKTCYAFINEIKSTLELNYFFEYINH